MRGRARVSLQGSFSDFGTHFVPQMTLRSMSKRRHLTSSQQQHTQNSHARYIDAVASCPAGNTIERKANVIAYAYRRRSHSSPLVAAASAGLGRWCGARAPARSVVGGAFASSTALDGRMLLLLSTDERTEPRFQVSQRIAPADLRRRCRGFAIKAGCRRQRQCAGYPVQTLSDISRADYWCRDCCTSTTRSSDPTVTP